MATKNGDGKRFGKTTGLSMIEWYNRLFAAQGKRRLSDADIAKAVTKEFPGRDNYQKPAAYRSYYNQGLHGLGVKNAKGEAVAPKVAVERYGERCGDLGNDFAPKPRADKGKGSKVAAKKGSSTVAAKKGSSTVAAKKAKGSKAAA